MNNPIIPLTQERMTTSMTGKGDESPDTTKPCFPLLKQPPMNNIAETTKELQELSDTLVTVQRRIANLIPALVECHFDYFELATISTSLTSLPRFAKSLKKAADELAKNDS